MKSLNSKAVQKALKGMTVVSVDWKDTDELIAQFTVFLKKEGYGISSVDDGSDSLIYVLKKGKNWSRTEKIAAFAGACDEEAISDVRSELEAGMIINTIKPM